MLKMCVNILAVGILKSPFKHALVCLSLFFSLSIYVCKKACHLLLDQPLQMALPLLLSLLLLLPPLPPSLRPSTQVFAWFSFAKPPPPSIFQHRPYSLPPAACTTFTAVTKAWSRLPNDGCFGCTANSLAWAPLLSLSNIQKSDLWIDLYT